MAKQQYNQAEFRIPARDGTRGSVRISVRIQSEQDRVAKAVVYSRRFPYRNEAEFHRHAIQRHLEWLGALEDVPGMLARFQMRRDAREWERESGLFEIRFQSLELQVHHHLAMGRRGQARKLLEWMRGNLLKVENPYWRERNLDELHKRWGYLLDASGTSHHPFDGGA